MLNIEQSYTSLCDEYLHNSSKMKMSAHTKVFPCLQLPGLIFLRSKIFWEAAKMLLKILLVMQIIALKITDLGDKS